MSRRLPVSDGRLAEFFSTIGPLLNERQRRLVGAALVAGMGRGGQARVAEASGMSRNTLIAGAKELAGGAEPWDRVRRPGAGRKFAEEIDPGLLDALESLVEPDARGDPMSPLRWTLKSTRTLAAELGRLGHQAEASVVGQLLPHPGYSLQANAKVAEGAQHADRDCVVLLLVVWVHWPRPLLAA